MPGQIQEMLEGVVNGEFGERLEALKGGLSDHLKKALAATLHKSNPTYSGQTADWRRVWDERAERFFAASGLRDLNAAFGYQ